MELTVLGSMTLSETVPAVVSRPVAMGTVIDVLLIELGVMVDAPPTVGCHRTVEPAAKFVPVTIRLKPVLPATRLVRLRDVMDGPACTRNAVPADCTPLGSRILTEAEPTEASNPVGMSTVI